MDPVTAMRTGRHPTRVTPRRKVTALRDPHHQGDALSPSNGGERQWKLSPQAQLPLALGLSIVKPCFSIVSAKSIVAPSR
jgi:hypothetical protein